MNALSRHHVRCSSHLGEIHLSYPDFCAGIWLRYWLVGNLTKPTLGEKSTHGSFWGAVTATKIQTHKSEVQGTLSCSPSL